MKKNKPPLEFRGFYYKIQKVTSEKFLDNDSFNMECFFTEIFGAMEKKLRFC